MTADGARPARSPASTSRTSSSAPATGDARAVARLISLVEDASPLLREVMAGARAARRQRPGRRASPARPASASRPPPPRWSASCAEPDKRVGVLAVDPSSPFSGGALLGDRVRMQDHATRPRGLHPLDGLARPPRRAGLDDPAGAAGARRGRLRRDPGRDRRRRAERGRDRRARRHHAGAARARHGRRHPGREGRDPRDRRRLRRQQGRPRRRRPGPPRPALDARARPSAPRARWKPPIVKTVASQGRGPRRGGRRDRRAPRLARVLAASWSAGVPAGPATRSRRSRSPRCASAGATSTAARELDDLAAAVVAGDDATPTPPPTSCWPPSAAEPRSPPWGDRGGRSPPVRPPPWCRPGRRGSPRTR